MSFDVAVVSGDSAGLTITLHLADRRRVVVINERSLPEDASDWAQGGIATVLGSGDSHDERVNGTLIAGAGLCDEAATRYIVESGRSVVGWLIGHSVPFTRDEQAELDFHLVRGGGHRHRRIIHATDATDHAAVTTLVEKVCSHPNIMLLEDHFAIDLITDAELDHPGMHYHSLYALDIASGHVKAITAGRTVMATGGAGKVYLYTTNPDTASNDGIAMAWRAGYRMVNMEFIQLYPTCLYHPFAKSPLIIETVRGEGDKLILPDGTRFILVRDEHAKLAPRDVVARAINFEMEKRSLDCVYLDINHQSPTFLREHFLTIVTRCLELGIDIMRQSIPVVLMTHCTHGGVVTDHLGCTDIAGLYAAGETTHAGLHGANRLASGSLLGCMVIGRGATEDVLTQPPSDSTSVQIPAWDESRVTGPDEEVVVSHNQDKLHRMMWGYVGIMHMSKWLKRAQRHITPLREETTEYYANFRVNHSLLELRNLVEAASPIVDSALSRHESHDLRFSRDYPETLPKALPTIMQPTYRQIARKR